MAVIFLILRGQLIPRSTYEDRMKDKDSQIDYLRVGLQNEVRRGDVLASQLSTLMEVASTTEHVLTSLSMVTRKGDPEHETASSS